jgi:hypothetical protein
MLRFSKHERDTWQNLRNGVLSELTDATVATRYPGDEWADCDRSTAQDLVRKAESMSRP